MELQIFHWFLNLFNLVMILSFLNEIISLASPYLHYLSWLTTFKLIFEFIQFLSEIFNSLIQPGAQHYSKMPLIICYDSKVLAFSSSLTFSIWCLSLDRFLSFFMDFWSFLNITLWCLFYLIDPLFQISGTFLAQTLSCPIKISQISSWGYRTSLNLQVVFSVLVYLPLRGKEDLDIWR